MHSYLSNYNLFSAAAFLTGVTSLSLLGGFGMTLGWAKKQDPEMFNKGVAVSLSHTHLRALHDYYVCMISMY